MTVHAMPYSSSTGRVTLYSCEREIQRGQLIILNIRGGSHALRLGLGGDLWYVSDVV